MTNQCKKSVCWWIHVRTCDSRTVDEVCRKLTPLRHGSRHDGGCRGRECVVVKPVGQVDGGLSFQSPKFCTAKGISVAESQGVAGKPVSQCSDDWIGLICRKWESINIMCGWEIVFSAANLALVRFPLSNQRSRWKLAFSPLKHV